MFAPLVMIAPETAAHRTPSALTKALNGVEQLGVVSGLPQISGGSDRDARRGAAGHGRASFYEPHTDARSETSRRDGGPCPRGRKFSSLLERSDALNGVYTVEFF